MIVDAKTNCLCVYALICLFVSKPQINKSTNHQINSKWNQQINTSTNKQT